MLSLEDDTKNDTISYKDAEAIYFSMFQNEPTEKFCRMLLLLAHANIEKYKGITVNKLQWKLHDGFAIEDRDVDVAIHALCNPKVFNAASKFHVSHRMAKYTKEIVHLRPRKNSCRIQNWKSDVFIKHPEFKVLEKQV